MDADLLAERIVQLNGKPDFNTATLTDRSHAEYDDADSIQAMIKANLIAERVAIEAYRQMIEQIGESDPTTRHMLVGIMAMEEEHADDMRDLLARTGAEPSTNTPEQFAAFLKKDIALWAKVVKDAKIPLQTW